MARLTKPQLSLATYVSENASDETDLLTHFTRLHLAMLDHNEAETASEAESVKTYASRIAERAKERIGVPE